MIFKFIMESESPDEMKEYLDKLYGSNPEDEKLDELFEEKPKKKKAKKKAPQAKKQPAPKSNKEKGEATFDDAHAALQRVNAECGISVAKEMLNEFGANKLSELKPEHFEAFVAKCETVGMAGA